MDTIQILTKPKYIIDYYLVKQAKKLNLSLDEFLVLMYFQNSIVKNFDLQEIIDALGLSEKEILAAFNSLISKKVLVIETKKDDTKKMREVVSLNNLYKLIYEDIENSQKNALSSNVFEQFEKEFGRPISSMEYEIINSWLEKNYSEEIINCALKEAVYNGVKTFRYIDKILYEWQKKGLKSSKDVKNHLANYRENKNANKSKALFDYNWLDDDS